MQSVQIKRVVAVSETRSTAFLCALDLRQFLAIWKVLPTEGPTTMYRTTKKHYLLIITIVNITLLYVNQNNMKRPSIVRTVAVDCKKKNHQF